MNTIMYIQIPTVPSYFGLSISINYSINLLYYKFPYCHIIFIEHIDQQYNSG